MYNLKDIRRYREKNGKKKLVLDTNLFVLLFIGGYDNNFLNQCTCTQKYSKNDYDLLLKIFQYFDSEIIITPHILAEISNLSRRDIKEPNIANYFETIVDRLKNCKEEHVSLDRLLGLDIKILTRFGFPDMSVIEAAKKMDAVILTDEYALSGHATSSGLANIRFGTISANYLIDSND